MSTFKLDVNELSKIIINGYKDILEHALHKEITKHLDPIVDNAVKDLAERIRVSVNSWKHIEEDKVLIELHIDKTKVEY